MTVLLPMLRLGFIVIPFILQPFSPVSFRFPAKFPTLDSDGLSSTYTSYQLNLFSELDSKPGAVELGKRRVGVIDVGKCGDTKGMIKYLLVSLAGEGKGKRQSKGLCFLCGSLSFSVDAI